MPDENLDDIPAADRSTYQAVARKVKNLQNKSKSSAFVGAGIDLCLIPTPPGTPNVVGLTLAIRQVFKSREHIKMLKKLNEQSSQIQCTCPDKSCEAIVAYAIHQKEKRIAKSSADGVGAFVPFAIGIVASGNIWRMSRSVWKNRKGTKGVARRENATQLYNAARGWERTPEGSAKPFRKVHRCPMAVAIIEELFRQDSGMMSGIMGKMPKHDMDAGQKNADAVVKGKTGKPRRSKTDDKHIDLLFEKLSSG